MMKLIKITFRCDGCGHSKGTVITDDRETVVECDSCKLWETMGGKTTNENPTQSGVADKIQNIKTTKYFKKPIEVEAIQWNGKNLEECEEFVGELLDVANGSVVLKDSLGGRYVLRNDWIVRDADKNKVYPCEPDNFAKYYAKK